MPIEVGEELPSVDLFEDGPDNQVNTLDFCKGRKVIIIGVPGAFTPNCSETHLPGFVELSEQIKEKGISEIACISVNDPFVMKAWSNTQNTEGKVRMLADPKGTFTEAIGMKLTLKELGAILGNVRSRRYMMIVEDGIVIELDVEPDQIGLTNTLSESVLVRL